MILDRNLTPGDGAPEVEICGHPYHGLALLETFTGTAINGGNPLSVGVWYQIGVTPSLPDGARYLQSLNLTPSYSLGPYGDTSYQVWYDAEAGRIMPRDTGLFPAVVTATFEAGVITLPNAQKMSVRMPSNGDTYKLMAPGTPAVTRTTDQMSADVVNGYQWLDHLVLSGDQQQIYGGHDLGKNGWIYCASDGKKWWIKLTSPTTISGNSATFDFQIKPFGLYPATSSLTTQSVTLADLGQTATPIELSVHTWDAGWHYCDTETLRIDLDDVRHDGAVAVLALRSECQTNLPEGSNYMPEWALTGHFSLGFLRVAVAMVAGVPSISASVLYTREQTLGTGTMGTYTLDALNDRILGVWFDASGNPVPVLYSFSTSKSQTYTPNNVCPGTDTISGSETVNCRLEWGPQSIDIPFTSSYTSTSVCALVTNPLDPLQPLHEVRNYGSGNFDFAGLLAGSHTFDFTQIVGLSGSAVAVPMPAYFHWFWNYFDMYCDEPRALTWQAGHIRTFANDSATSTGTGDQAVWAIKRISNKHFGVLAMRCTADDRLWVGNNSTDGPYIFQDTADMVWLGGITPSGPDVLAGDLGINAQYIPTGSVNPTTGDAYLQPDGKRVCFV